jgi:hypothetical protein
MDRMDLLISAHAQVEAPVLTNNATGFHRVAGLTVEDWRIDRVIRTSQRQFRIFPPSSRGRAAAIQDTASADAPPQMLHSRII